jgi:hypothetical protein
MKKSVFALASVLLAVQPLGAQEAVEEVLPYAINWPSGLGLGEAAVTARKIKTQEGEERWRLELKLDASVPGFAVSDTFRSETTAEFCSVRFERELKHGKRSSKERITFHPEKRTVERETVGGGKSELPAPPCARDPLALLFFARQELRHGRIPAAQPAYYGAAYDTQFEAGGTQKVRSGDAIFEADRLMVTIKGPVVQSRFEVFFARDAARTPLRARIPLPLATLTVELAR